MSKTEIKHETRADVDVAVKIGAAEYRTFALFHLLHHEKRWRRPLLFAVIMLAFAIACFTQMGTREGAALLGGVLTVVALGIPAAYFGMFFRDLGKQCKALTKAGPTQAYRLRLTEAGLGVWQPGEMDRAEPPQSFVWADMHCVYHTPEAIYLYVQPAKAFLLPLDQMADGGAAAWALAKAAKDCREVS